MVDKSWLSTRWRNHGWARFLRRNNRPPWRGESSWPRQSSKVALFILQNRGQFQQLVSPMPVTVTPAYMWGPFTFVDCIGYYAWLRSPLIDGDFMFDDEFAPTLARIPEAKWAICMTPTGHWENRLPVGPALAWAPAVVTVHLLLCGLGRYAPWPADGYSPPYQIAVGGTTLALALLTLVLLYRMRHRFSGPTAAAAAAALLTLATPVLAYGAVDVAMSHGPATAFLTLFVFIWLRNFGSTPPKSMARTRLLARHGVANALAAFDLCRFARRSKHSRWRSGRSAGGSASKLPSGWQWPG